MYYYLFDTVVGDKKYESLVNRIDFRLIELGLNGRMDKLTILKNMRELIEAAIKRGAETVVIVGDDEAITKAISILAPYDVTLGIIPVGPNQRISRALGIPDGEGACDILSKRVVKTIDLGKVNEQYFLFSLEIPAQDVTVECDGHYRISVEGMPRPFSICNLHPNPRISSSNPEDGILEAVIEDEGSRGMFRKFRGARQTVLPLKRAKIQSASNSIALMLDGHTVVKTPALVEVAPKKLRVIVGKDRQF